LLNLNNCLFQQFYLIQKLQEKRTEVLLQLERYFYTSLEIQDFETIQKQLLSFDFINAAYLEPIAELAQSTPNFQARQGYLNKSGDGVDMYHAYDMENGQGQNVSVVDVEGDWDFDHEDLIAHQGRLVAGVRAGDAGWTNHGSAVLCEIAGVDNGFGVTGIASKSKVFGASIYVAPGRQGPAATAMINGSDFLRKGDVMLIELHRIGPAGKFIAMEWWPAEFLALKYATDKGVIVTEAAGNGNELLDLGIYNRPQTGFPPEWKNPFNRTLADSGAILCGASAPPARQGRDWGPNNSRLDFSNYGSSLDANGWGREVVTCGYGDLQRGTRQVMYTSQFSGTSSASPIVTGTVAVVQGLAKSRGALLTPAQVRALFRRTGFAQTDHPQRPASQRIGSRPDLKQMIEEAEKLNWIPKKK